MGTLMLGEVDAIVRRYVGRLRVDPLVPKAQGASDSQLEDHTPTFLAEIAKSLIVVEEAGGELSDLMRDGTALQRLIAERHGRQRHRLGWTEDADRREFE